jgi:tetratricopeptide (TPR) repeat protein
VPAVAAGEAALSYRRGFALLQEDHLDEAIEQLDEALKRDPTMSLAYNARGYAHYRQKQYGDALADFNIAILLNPAYANAYFNRSYAHRALGETAAADADAAKARELTAKSGK